VARTLSVVTTPFWEADPRVLLWQCAVVHLFGQEYVKSDKHTPLDLVIPLLGTYPVDSHVYRKLHEDAGGRINLNVHQKGSALNK
jgi:hypothetical protein